MNNLLPGASRRGEGNRTTGRPAFLITIDTEGDNIWSRGADVATRNTAYLPRFQQLCERFGFKPTWLTNYEMAMDTAFVEFGCEVIKRQSGEIGMHLHAWNSPPLIPLTDDDNRWHPYLIEFPAHVMREKVTVMTDLLEQRFACKMRSHRAGRWAFDSRYARLLVEHGYEVDCSVTPAVSWRDQAGVPGGAGGSDYRHFPDVPYYVDLNNISQAGNALLLEVPMTTQPSALAKRLPLCYSIPGLRSIAYRVAPPVLWLRPNGRNLGQMLHLVRSAAGDGRSHIEFMLHSSEFMPGGSPTFVTKSQIEKLYDDLEELFSEVAQHFEGMTLSGFAQQFREMAKS